MQHKKDTKPKEAYEKPKLRIIELAADEILAIGCKTAPGGPGQSGAGCTNPACSLAIGS